MKNAEPLLLHFRISHYNEKVRWALDFKSIPHRRKALVPGFHIPLARWHSGQNQLPVLVLGSEVLHGSNHILSELERRYPQHALLPANAAQKSRAREIEVYFDQEVAPELRRLVWACYLPDAAACVRMAADGASPLTRQALHATLPLLRPLFRRNMQIEPAALERARLRLRGHFDRLAAEIGSSGYLVGEQFGHADLCAASVMTAIIRPPQFPYPLPEPWPQALIELRASVADHPAFQWVLDIYARHRSPSTAVSG